ncbi:hypothetical protein [Natronococcus pandeyae]|uniref:hypothetical protein n=1 Tax=Natronococcus pandeyae TaxID=2055836 RepID=UPI0011E63987|nr:hypothetical protein [Natronococcus pandeyae]
MELPTSRVVFGLRHYIQHENILPLVIWQSSHSSDSPAYALSKQELQMGEGYHEGFKYHYGTIDGPVIFPFESIRENKPAIEVLRQRVRILIKKYQSDELLEYKERLEEMQVVWDEITEEQGISPLVKGVIESDQSIPSELRELVEETTE